MLVMPPNSRQRLAGVHRALAAKYELGKLLAQMSVAFSWVIFE